MSQPVFGHVGSYRPGDTFRNRIELALSGVHRPRRAGVCGTQQLGAESIVLAGQYEDDDFSEEEIKTLHDFYCLLAELAKKDNDLGKTHSVEEAEDNHNEKLAAHVD